MNNVERNYWNHIATKCYENFDKLPKTGKPNLKEWTILSCIVKEDAELKYNEVIALGTGSKCIGRNQMSSKGDILNDSHSEIICRRAFLKYLYEQIEHAFDGNQSIFTINESSICVLRNTIKFHFFSTQVPCGDASIFPKQNENELHGNCLSFITDNICLNQNSVSDNCKKRKSDNSDEANLKKQKVSDIYRTGAKCLENDIKKDPRLSSNEYHVTGAIRTKPGRGDPTLSVSCSDKIARWIRLGIQGSLLSILLSEPIYLSSLIIAGETPFSESALRRSLFDRFTNTDFKCPYRTHFPIIGQADIGFLYRRNKEREEPSPTSIIWAKVASRPFEVSVNGKKQGVTKKNFNTPASELSICKKQLASLFMKIINKNPVLKKYIYTCNSNENLTYLLLKEKAINYRETWDTVKNNVFKTWTVKDKSLLQFEVFE